MIDAIKFKHTLLQLATIDDGLLGLGDIRVEILHIKHDELKCWPSLLKSLDCFFNYVLIETCSSWLIIFFYGDTGQMDLQETEIPEFEPKQET